MTDLAAWITTTAPTLRQQLQASKTYSAPALGAYLMCTDYPDVFGIPGAAWWLDQQHVSVETVQALEAALQPFPWWRQGVAEAIEKKAAQLQALDLSRDVLIDIDRVSLVRRFTDAGINSAAIFPLDEEYKLCSSDTLRRVVESISDIRRYYRWQNNVDDCDNRARAQWGRLADLIPGNLSAGICSITHADGAHMPILAACTDGLFFIENDGTVYNFGLEYWTRKNVTVQLLVI